MWAQGAKAGSSDKGEAGPKQFTHTGGQLPHIRAWESGWQSLPTFLALAGAPPRGVSLGLGACFGTSKVDTDSRPELERKWAR